MTDYIITKDDDATATAELQEYAEVVGWAGVDPLTQQRIRLRSTGHDAVVQRRGAFWFAYSSTRGSLAGPSSSRAAAVREVTSATPAEDVA